MEKIRKIKSRLVSDTVREMFIAANHVLPSDVRQRLSEAKNAERDPLAKKVLCRLEENISVAEEKGIPVCQDTGMAIVFAEVGKDVHLIGTNLEDAVNEGVRRAYLDGKLRLSVVSDPLYERKNTEDNTPAILHVRMEDGDKLRLTVAPKGFGSENMSRLRMFTPSATEADIIDFVVETVRAAGSNPCPPIVVGVGIGGDFEYSALLAKRALTRELTDSHPKQAYAALETKIEEKLRALHIGPQGFGGDTTALAVKVEYAPTHIAGLPVAVNINCHVVRHLTREI